MSGNETQPEAWSAKIEPKSSLILDFSPDYRLNVTSISFDQINSNEPSVISVNIRTPIGENDPSEGESSCFKSDDFPLGTLTPNKCDQITVSHQFSPFEIAEVSNSGPNAVILSGHLSLIDDFSCIEEEEEEEEGEKEVEIEISPDEIQKRFAKMVKEVENPKK